LLFLITKFHAAKIFITLVKEKPQVKIPLELLNSLQNVKGFDPDAFMTIHEHSERITSIRFNSFKPCETDFNPGSQVPWCQQGHYLEERPAFTFDPLFHAGCYYVQEAGSMFISHALRHSADLSKDVCVLDLCGAPGGKATLLNDMISENSILISNEVIKPRSEILSYNLSKWGTCNSAVTNNDPQVFASLEQVFDVIVADVPCSGSGLFRKQPEAVEEWSTDNVKLCSLRQKRIVADALPSLKEGGIFIYSTCSYSKEENEDIVEWLQKEFQLELINIPLEPDWGIVDTGLGYRFFPYLTKSEGFFCAVLKKSGHTFSREQRPSKSMAEKPSGNEMKFISEKIKAGTYAEIIKYKEDFKLVSKHLLTFRDRYGSHLYFKKLGTTIGQLKRDDFIPDHEFAQSIYIGDKIRKTELSRPDAVSFLQKENISLEAEKGLTLMCYKNHGIGWAKVLGNRINNYLPKDYRILSREE
jgi:16S rRNA C967 or C1407 C5-methylase (RsmB/RsmF family)/NOL1/NOP2/fmu family ribosome biogenesis protein